MTLLDRLIERHRRLARDDRAIAINLFIFAIGLLVGAALIVIFNGAVDTMLDISANQTSSTAASEGQGYLEDAWAAFPLAIIGFSTLQLVAAAAFRR